MNKLKFIFILFVVFTYSCKKDEVDVNSSSFCDSNCFEISGVITNKSTNTIEANRKIKVHITTNSIPNTYQYIGDVTTDANGVYIVKLHKTDFQDANNVNVMLTLDDKPGYANLYHSNQYYLANLNLGKSYVKDISVYQLTKLNVIFKNTNPSDSISLLDLVQNDFVYYYNYNLGNILYVGDSDTIETTAMLGVQSNLQTWYVRSNSIELTIKYDSVTCTNPNNNEIILNIN